VLLGMETISHTVMPGITIMRASWTVKGADKRENLSTHTVTKKLGKEKDYFWNPDHSVRTKRSLEEEDYAQVQKTLFEPEKGDWWAKSTKYSEAT